MCNGTLTITRRLDNTLNELREEFTGFEFNGYFKDEFITAVEGLYESEGLSDHSSRLIELFRMFDSCGISYERNKDNDYYARLVEDSDLPVFKDVETRMISAMYSVYGNYPAPEEYMKRIVDHLSDPDDHWENDTLRLRILKQFIKYGDYLSGAITTSVSKEGNITEKTPGGKRHIRQHLRDKGYPAETSDDVLTYIDDTVFDALSFKETSKEQKKLYGKYGILKVADDLAGGKFRVWGVTKRDLYLFAMVYGMTYYSGSEDRAIVTDRWTDISINLFRDYYSNNFIRFITDTYRGHMQEFELDPSGQGINYKNYAEMVYLYYISKDMPAIEKIRKSHEMIDRIKREMRGKGKPANSDPDSNTERLRAYFKKQQDGSVYSEDILAQSEDDFEAFLKDNYLCDTSTDHGDISPMQLESDHNTAYAEYRKIVGRIKAAGLDPDECRYGLWFAAEVSCEDALENAKENIKDIDEKKFRDLSDLLVGINKYIKDEKVFGARSGGDVTRSLIIAAYYYWYIEEHMGDEADCMGFADVFSDFQYGANKYLNRIHYQPFSGRNIYDVLLAFSAYAVLYS